MGRYVGVQGQKNTFSEEKTCKEVSNYIIWNERENIKICALFMSIL